MAEGILARKLGMTQCFEEDGTVVPVTVLEAGPCKVLQLKVKDETELAGQRSATVNHGRKRGKHDRPRRADGYYAVQLGFDLRPAKSTTQPFAGHAAKAGVADGQGYYFVKEIRWDALPPYEEGQELDISVLDGVERVDVTGTTKGRGWAGVIKRWGFRRQPMSHGTKKVHRHAGGLGRTYSTAKGVPKGKKMPGHYGVDRVTVQGLEIARRDPERNLLLVKGAVPGPNRGYVLVRRSVLERRGRAAERARGEQPES